MTITDSDDGVTRVHLTGRLDASGSDAIGVRFTAAVVPKGRNAVIDLSGVTFVASLGLRLLIATSRGLTNKGHRMALFGAPPLVQEVLDNAAIDQIMPVTATEAEALVALST
jgi:anti-sigma B factor antagonist